uniref:Transmembrane protein n=1 Tax=Octopus bimaculoides TaxID=37653 RepID=A0A0L8GBJ5_OCTBM
MWCVSYPSVVLGCYGVVMPGVGTLLVCSVPGVRVIFIFGAIYFINALSVSLFPV